MFFWNNPLNNTGFSYALHGHDKDNRFDSNLLPPNDGERVHIAYSYNGTQVSLYINGEYKASITTSTPATPQSLVALGGKWN